MLLDASLSNLLRFSRIHSVLSVIDQSLIFEYVVYGYLIYMYILYTAHHISFPFIGVIYYDKLSRTRCLYRV